MTPLQLSHYHALEKEQGKHWKAIANLESKKMALLSPHRGWGEVFDGNI